MAITLNILVLITLVIGYLFSKVNWQLLSLVIDHLQFIAILPLLGILKIDNLPLYFKIMQYIIGPPDLYAYGDGDDDYVER